MAADQPTSTQGKWPMFFASLLVILYTVIPLAWMFSLSVKSDAAQSDPELNTFGNFWPVGEGFTWDNYKLILTGDAQLLFVPALVNSLVICLLATAISVLLATLCAYAISRLSFPGKGLILFTAFAVHDDEVTLWRGAETKRAPLNDSMVTFDGHDIPRSDMDAELTFDNEGRWIYVDGSFAAAASAARSAISAG